MVCTLSLQAGKMEGSSGGSGEPSTGSSGVSAARPGIVRWVQQGPDVYPPLFFPAESIV